MVKVFYTLNGLQLPAGVSEIWMSQPGFEVQVEFAKDGTRMQWAGPKNDKSILIKGTGNMGHVTADFLSQMEIMDKQIMGQFVLSVSDGSPDRTTIFDHSNPPAFTVTEIAPHSGHYSNFELRLWRIS